MRKKMNELSLELIILKNGRRIKNLEKLSKEERKRLIERIKGVVNIFLDINGKIEF